MKKMFLKKGSFILLALFVGLLVSPTSKIYAGGDIEDTEPFEDPDAPLDGGLSILLAAGATLGAKKVYDLRKKNNDNNS